MTKDPVCGKRISRGKAYATVEYNHILYFLCCPLCQSHFEEQPNRFAKPEIGIPAKKTVK